MIEVTMTEVCTYTAEYTLEEFAALIGVEPTEEAIRQAVEDEADSDYGVEGANALLDDMVDRHLDSVTEREWEISV